MLLIVDDEIRLGRLLKRAFVSRGVDVLLVDTLEAATMAIDRLDLEAVLTDVRLTGVGSTDGLDVLAHARARAPALPVVVMTGYGDAEVESEALRRGAAAYFEKPVDLRTLFHTLERVGLKLGPAPRGSGRTGSGHAA